MIRMGDMEKIKHAEKREKKIKKYVEKYKDEFNIYVTRVDDETKEGFGFLPHPNACTHIAVEIHNKDEKNGTGWYIDVDYDGSLDFIDDTIRDLRSKNEVKPC